MPRPSSRLDLLLVPTDRAVAIDVDAWKEIYGRWQERGWLEGSRPGPAVDELLVGGFARVWRDDPGVPTLYANQQGGFRVRCPVQGSAIAREFGRAVQSWRQGGPFALTCPVCDQEHALDAMDLQPKVRFGRGAIVFSAANGMELEPGALAEVKASFGPLEIVLRRV